MRISDWSSDVCSSDLQPHRRSHCPARRTHPAQHPGRFSHPARLPTPALNPPPKEPAMTAQATAEQLQHDWNSNPRWQGITRPYSAAEVVRLRRSEERRVGKARVSTVSTRWASFHE